MKRIALAMALGSLPSTARADFTEEDRLIDLSAFTLRQGEARLGLFQGEVGLLDEWYLGTYWAPWVLVPITKSPIVNAYTKVKILDLGPPDEGRFVLSARVNFFWANIEDFHVQGVDEGRFKAGVLPFIVLGSYVVDDVWTATLETSFVQTWIDGSAESSGDGEFAGVGAQRNLQIAAIGEARLGRHVALLLVLRYAPWVEDLRLQTQIAVEESTSTSVDAALGSGTSGTSWLVQPGIAFSWGAFNLQLGLGYGNLFLPGIKTVGGLQTVVPDLDVSFRF